MSSANFVRWDTFVESEVGGAYTLQMETEGSCEGLVGMYQTTRRHIGKYTSLDWYQHWNHLTKFSVTCQYQKALVSVQQVRSLVSVWCVHFVCFLRTPRQTVQQTRVKLMRAQGMLWNGREVWKPPCSETQECHRVLHEESCWVMT